MRRRAVTRRVSAIALGLLLATLAACGAGADGGDGGDGGGDDGGGQGEDITLDVLAASSLTESFGALAEDFEADNPGVTVRLSFGSSAALAQQVTEGAPADVLATADSASMELAGDDVEEPVEFATNELVLVVPADNPAGISSLDDLADAQFVTCVDSAPCGSLAAQLLASATRCPPSRSRARPTSRPCWPRSPPERPTPASSTSPTPSPPATRSPPSRCRARPSCPPATSSRPSPPPAEPELARAWLDLVTGDAGRRTLEEAGFGPAATGP